VQIEECKMKKDKYCLPSGDSCPDGTDKKKKKLFSAHDILYWVDKDDPRGDYPKNPQKDPQFSAWEKGVEKWGAKENFKSSDNIEQCD